MRNSHILPTGEKIKAWRESLGLTRKQMGEKLGVDPQTIYAWEADRQTPRIRHLESIERFLIEQGKVVETSVPDTVSTEPEPIPAPESPVDAFAHLRAQLDAIQADLYASEGSPLERDLALWDRDPEELQGAAGGALRHCRDRLRLSLHNVSQLCGIPSKRLVEMETRTGEPPTLHEIRQLREALGVEFDPRAVAFSDRDNPRPTLEESLREYREEWVRQRPPSKLDRILLLVERMSTKVDRMSDSLAQLTEKDRDR